MNYGEALLQRDRAAARMRESAMEEEVSRAQAVIDLEGAEGRGSNEAIRKAQLVLILKGSEYHQRILKRQRTATLLFEEAVRHIDGARFLQKGALIHAAGGPQEQETAIAEAVLSERVASLLDDDEVIGNEQEGV